MKILITGVHGFVGSNLVKYLASNNTIYGLDVVAPEKVSVEKTFSWYDIDNDVIPPVDAIIHLAGKAHDTKNQTIADEYFKVNRDLTIKVFDYFASRKTSKFVFFSTAKAAADKVEGVLKEEVIPSPVGPYGESKIAAESYILNCINNRSHSFDKKGVYIFRPCMIHGPGNRGNLNLLYRLVSNGIPWPLGAFDNHRTFTSIENMCYAVNGVLTKSVESGIYNMGDDEPLSTNELIELMCAALGKKAHIWKISRGFMNICAKIGGALHLPLNPERMQKLTESYVSSNEKIKAALGIESFPVDARTGLTRTIKSFIKQEKIAI